MPHLSSHMSLLLKRLIAIFLWVLLLQFVLQTRVTFVWWRDGPLMSVVWLWKEILVGVLLVWWAWRGLRDIKLLFHHRWFLSFVLACILGVLTTLIVHVFVLDLSLSTRALAFKYDFLWFIIFIAGVLVWRLLGNDTTSDIVKRYTVRIMKRALLLALVWYAVIFIKPGTLKLLWYDNFVYEWTVWHAPPAAYYTHLNYGIPRNQFLFERPITRWFFLLALWPLFFMQVLYKQPLRYTRAWRLIYGANIFVTFSRAARWAWLLQILLLWFLLAKVHGNVKRTLIRIIIPTALVIGVVWFFGGKELVVRDYSTNGHVAMVLKGIAYFSQSPWFGLWWASVWPGSHHLGWLAFNPENQFLQILVEFGIVWWRWWFVCYIMLNLVWILRRYSWHRTASRQEDHIGVHDVQHGTQQHDLQYAPTHETAQLLLACSVGMIWLSIVGMVLHSFTDRMIVYPYMLLFGIILSRTLPRSRTLPHSWD